MENLKLWFYLGHWRPLQKLAVLNPFRPTEMESSTTPTCKHVDTITVETIMAYEMVGLLSHVSDMIHYY